MPSRRKKKNMKKQVEDGARVCGDELCEPKTEGGGPGSASSAQCSEWSITDTAECKIVWKVPPRRGKGNYETIEATCRFTKFASLTMDGFLRTACHLCYKELKSAFNLGMLKVVFTLEENATDPSRSAIVIWGEDASNTRPCYRSFTDGKERIVSGPATLVAKVVEHLRRRGLRRRRGDAEHAFFVYCWAGDEYSGSIMGYDAEGGLCAVCREEEATWIFVRCQHKCVCTGCAHGLLPKSTNLTSCVLCRTVGELKSTKHYTGLIFTT